MFYITDPETGSYLSARSQAAAEAISRRTGGVVSNHPPGVSGEFTPPADAQQDDEGAPWDGNSGSFPVEIGVKVFQPGEPLPPPGVSVALGPAKPAPLAAVPPIVTHSADVVREVGHVHGTPHHAAGVPLSSEDRVMYAPPLAQTEQATAIGVLHSPTEAARAAAREAIEKEQAARNESIFKFVSELDDEHAEALQQVLLISEGSGEAMLRFAASLSSEELDMLRVAAEAAGSDADAVLGDGDEDDASDDTPSEDAASEEEATPPTDRGE